jgi:hypothetical protein
LASAWPRFSEAELERALRDVGPALDYPVSEHVAFAVRERLERAAVRSRRRARLPRLRPGNPLRPLFVPAWQRAAVAVLALVVLVSGALAFSPSVRKAVAGWLGIRGVKIEVTPSLPPVPLGRNLVLGPPVSLARAQAAVPFRILLPSAPGVGMPDEVDLIQSISTGQVSLLYRARPGLPAATRTGVGLILTEFEARAETTFIEKKLVLAGNNVESVTVNGEPGFWIEGAHELIYLGPDGEQITSRTRLAGNVLLWQHGSVTLRVEADITKLQALAIADSVH